MIFALLTLLAALALAAVAGWFSIIGFMAIYAGAPMYALIMGVVTECAKLVTTSWLYRNWPHSDWKIKGPLIYFTLALMTATSIGVFGFLSKAHLEQGAGTIDNSARIEQLNYQVNREKSSIADDEKVIGQLDATVNSFLGKDRTDKSLSVRKAQAPQRKQLRDEIASAQKRIDDLNQEKFKLESEVRKQQLDVGPIRYIAELFYGATGDTNKNIETAVRIFTLLLVSTLDPLAVILLVAANHTLMRIKDEKKEKDKVSPTRHLDGFYGEKDADKESSTRVQENIDTHGDDAGHHEPIYERLIPTPREGIAETALDVQIPEETVEILDEETQPAEENSTQNDELGDKFAVVVAAIEETVPAVGRDNEEGTVSTQIQESPPIQVEEINEIEEDLVSPEGKDNVGPEYEPPEEAHYFDIIDEEPETEVPKIELSDEVIEKFTPTLVSTPVFGVRQPSPTKVSSLSPIIIDVEPEEQIIPTLKPAPLPSLPTAKAPWAHNEAILREILGSSPHFIPQKVNEEEKSLPVQTPSTETSGAGVYSASPAESKIKEIYSVPSGENKEEEEEAPNRSDDAFWTANHKYPIALSWLSEFKRS
jgi:hypothetical protein